MKHILEYNNWTTDTSDGVDVDYYDGPKISEIALNVEDYINSNFNHISDVSYHNNYGYEIEFNQEILIYSIKLFKSTMRDDMEDYKLIIEYRRKNISTNSKNIIISKNDFEYIRKILHNTYIKYKKKKEDKSDDVKTILDELDPIKRSAKKYNI